MHVFASNDSSSATVVGMAKYSSIRGDMDLRTGYCYAGVPLAL